MDNELRRRWFAALLLSLPLLLSGCFKFTMDLEVSNDDKISGTAVVALSKELAGFAEESTGDDATDVFAEREGVTASEFDDGDFVGQQYEFVGVPIEELDFQDDAGGLAITRDGDFLKVAGDLNFEDNSADAGGDDFGFGQAFFDSADLRVSIKFPGEVRETNGELDEGTNTITWIPKYGEANEIFAVVYAPRGIPFWIWWGGGILVALLGLIVLAVVLSRRRKRGTVEGGSQRSAGGGRTSSFLEWFGFGVPRAAERAEPNETASESAPGVAPKNARFSYEVPSRSGLASFFGGDKRETFQVWLTSDFLAYRFLKPDTSEVVAEESVELASILNAWYVANKRFGSAVRIEVEDGTLDIPAPEVEGKTLVRMLQRPKTKLGQTMAAEQQESEKAADASVFTDIERLGELRAKGLLTSEEFDSKKAELLKRI